MSKETLWKAFGVIVSSVIALMFVIACFLNKQATIAGQIAMAACVLAIWGVIVAMVLYDE